MRRLGNWNPDLAVIHYSAPDLTIEKTRIGGIKHFSDRYKEQTIVPEPFVIGATKWLLGILFGMCMRAHGPVNERDGWSNQKCHLTQKVSRSIPDHNKGSLN